MKRVWLLLGAALTIAGCGSDPGPSFAQFGCDHRRFHGWTQRHAAADGYSARRESPVTTG